MKWKRKRKKKRSERGRRKMFDAGRKVLNARSTRDY
jgi:hypothetical protein